MTDAATISLQDVLFPPAVQARMRGAILLNTTLDKAVMVRLACDGDWGFPKGIAKVGESDEDCATRVVWEMTGADISTRLGPSDFIEADLNRCRASCKLFIVPNIPFGLMAPPLGREQQEVQAIGWVTLCRLPGWNFAGFGGQRDRFESTGVEEFTLKLRDWVTQAVASNCFRAKSPALPDPQPEEEQEAQACPSQQDADTEANPDIQQLRAALAARDREVQQLQLEMGRLQASVLPQLSLAEYGLHDIPLESPTGMFVCHLVTSTRAQHRKQLGPAEFAPAPRLRVVRIQKTVNPRLYDKYMVGLHDLEGQWRHSGCPAFNAFPQCRVHDASLPMGRVDLNEHFAFHGAKMDVVNEICKAGFDPQRGGEGRGRMFGVAAYFALNSSKSDIYTGSLYRSSERKMILARLALGRVFRAEQHCQERTRPPGGYDSVWAVTRENGGSVDHPELMIYKEQQALPQFVITYRHECPEHQLCAECLKRPPL